MFDTWAAVVVRGSCELGNNAVDSRASAPFVHIAT